MVINMSRHVLDMSVSVHDKAHVARPAALTETILHDPVLRQSSKTKCIAQSDKLPTRKHVSKASNESSTCQRLQELE